MAAFGGGTHIPAISVTVLTVEPALAAKAVAAGQPGESYSWSLETENNSPLRSSDTVSEARNPNNGDLLQVWRGYNQTTIWAAVNHGQPFTIGAAQTYAAPRVVWSADGFSIFHTGIDRHIWVASSQASGPTLSNPAMWGNWHALPDNFQTPNYYPPSVTWLGDTHRTELYLTWHSATSQEEYGAWYGGGRWSAPQLIPGALSSSPGTVTWDPVTQNIFFAWRGLDNQVYITGQNYGHGWGNPAHIAGVTLASPSVPTIAAAADGTIQIAVEEPVAGQSYLRYGRFAPGLNWQGWTWDNTNAILTHSPYLVAAFNALYIVNTDANGYVYWKRTYQG